MRAPTSAEDKWDWWERAINGEEVTILETEPQCGFFKVRKFRYGEWPKGPWLPARIWMEQDIDPITGELLSDEIFRMQINGRDVNPWTAWTYVARHPITQTEWEWLRAMAPLRASKIPNRAA